MAKDLLQGIAPPRPLFLPIVFSLAARVENLPLPAFLANPTKISNALRQIRGSLRADGVTCYFDPYLELEALGAALQWTGDDQPPSLCWPGAAGKGVLPHGLRSPEGAVKAGRIPIAAEVIRRLAALLRDDTLLMAGITGPFTLAARLAQMTEQEVARPEDLPSSVLDLAAAMLTQVASALVQAGAHVIFIQEPVLPPLTADSCEAWSNLLSSAFNIIRFFGALPVLLLTNPAAVARNLGLVARWESEGILCPVLDGSSLGSVADVRAAKFGVALPTNSFSSNGLCDDFFRQVKQLHPAIITTAGDVPASTELKQMVVIFEGVRER